MSDETRSSTIALRLTKDERADLERRAKLASEQTGYKITVSDQVRHDIQHASTNVSIPQVEAEVFERLQQITDPEDWRREASRLHAQLEWVLGGLEKAMAARGIRTTTGG